MWIRNETKAAEKNELLERTQVEFIAGTILDK